MNTKERAKKFVEQITEMLKDAKKTKSNHPNQEYWRGYHDGLSDAHAWASRCYKLDKE